jgi:serine O-acetyltransferase
MWLETLRADTRRYSGIDSASLLTIFWKATHTPGILASIILRTQEAMYRRRRYTVAHVLRNVGVVMVGADFVPGCRVGPGLLIHHPVGVVLGGSVKIGAHATLLQHVTLGERYTDGRAHGSPTLADGVTVSVCTSILGGVTVGRGATIGAHSLVLHDVPDGATAVGAPARLITSGAAERGTSRG